VGVLRFFYFILLLCVFLLHHSLISILIRNKEKRLRYFLKSISLTARWGLQILNVKVTRQGIEGAVKNRLIVSNHLSYLDVLILFAYYPSLFVTSTEIRDTFFLGWICQLAGCFFVERRKEFRSDETKSNELKAMREKFHQGFNIFFFPEGTSSCGRVGVLPFKGTFFQLAVDTGSCVQPMCLKYTGANADIPPWYGSMSFLGHLWKLCLQNKITASLEILDEIPPQEKWQLTTMSYQKISEAYARH
jgi:1-acyl-sn-glycerol-3-phosphate acyltransferase